jgi:hypothetical protein
LNAKIPVVWPEDDWFKEDKAGPVPRNRYSQDRTRKPERKPRAAAPKRGERTDRPDRVDRPARPDRRKEIPAFKFTIPRGDDYFPGTFFGFAPEPPEGFDFSASSADPIEDDDIMDFEETSPSEVPENLPAPIDEIDEIESDDPQKLPEELPAESSDSPDSPEEPPAESPEPAPVKKKRRRRRYNKKKSPATASSESSVSSDSTSSESA